MKAQVKEVNLKIVQIVASRMLDPNPPFMGYFSFAGDLYRKICGISAEEKTLDLTLDQAKSRAKIELQGMFDGARDASKKARK